MSEPTIIDFEKAQFINQLPRTFSDVYRKSFKQRNVVSFHYLNFVPFCHAYAKQLLQNSDYIEYGNFINRFNELIKTDETFQFIKNTEIKGVFSRLHSDMTFIQDERYGINSEEFALEASLEKELFQQLADWFYDEKIVKTQQVVGYGRSDILINRTAIELKKTDAKRKDVYQTFEYSFDEDIDNICLIARNFDEKVLAIANRLRVHCYKYSFVYEVDKNEYPLGFRVEKISGFGSNDLDLYLSELENGLIRFIGYDQSFDFYEQYKNSRKMVESIIKSTSEDVDKQVRRALEEAESYGYDISKGLKSAIEQM